MAQLNAQQLVRLTYLLSDGWVSSADDESYSRSWHTFRECVREIDSAIELHCLAANLNWDYGYDGLYAIIDHPACDRGTARMLFWLGEPTVVDDDVERSAFLNHVVTRYQLLQSSAIKCDMTSVSDARIPSSGGPEIPEVMRTPISGVDLSTLVEAVRLLATLAWFDQNCISTDELAASLVIRTAGIVPSFAERLRVLASRLRSSDTSPHAVPELVGEIRALVMSTAGVAWG